ncbi:hypothetical protein QGN23_07915 [Chryseobacterium gotjawalense]|uniref:Uncharacterized protein n=1 Tax=Chryseobacterium gotjawalense TaxID=3042315 RepID=A0ABY8R9M3_9FLAO|nr:hypothetical protein [Chryseobacterium sp. wdc7]WHF50374.1 hypothetical protein QGN23_07915 [Chryseobacterium sp. wdc7]
MMRDIFGIEREKGLRHFVALIPPHIDFIGLHPMLMITPLRGF